jgi:hypothetical protein
VSRVKRFLRGAKLIQIIEADPSRVSMGLEMEWETDRCRAIACVS